MLPKTKLSGLILLILTACITSYSNHVYAQRRELLTLESAVDVALRNSYTKQELDYDLEQIRLDYDDLRVMYRPEVRMNITSPRITNSKDWRYNYSLGKYERTHKTQLWDLDLNISKPIKFSNGNISLSYDMDMDKTKSESYMSDSESKRFSHATYLNFTQPFFIPNNNKINFERGELSLERDDLYHLLGQVRLITSTKDDYYLIFSATYSNLIYNKQIENFREIQQVVEDITAQDPSRTNERLHVQLELINTLTSLRNNQNYLKIYTAWLKKELRMRDVDSLYVIPEINITPVSVDLEQALDFGLSLNPNMRIAIIRRHDAELSLESSKGYNAFRVNLDINYGLSGNEEKFESMWDDLNRYNSLSIRAYIPVLDWGVRKRRIEVYKVSLRESELAVEEQRDYIETEIKVSVNTFNHYQNQTLDLQNAVEIANQATSNSIERFRNDEISLQDLLQIVNRQQKIEVAFLTSYIKYRETLLDLTLNTFYDFENNITLEERFGFKRSNK